MRSDLVVEAMAHVQNRYQLTRLVSVATRALHRPGTRIQDTMNDVLVHLSRSSPIANKKSEQYFVADAESSKGAHPRTDPEARSGRERKPSPAIIDAGRSDPRSNSLQEVLP
jgi:hypothetical protein